MKYERKLLSLYTVFSYGSEATPFPISGFIFHIESPRLPPAPCCLMSSSRRPPFLLLAPFFGAFLLFWAVPLAKGFWLSLQTNTLFGDPGFAGLSNYRDLFGDPRFL